jgi:hypothetical protein
VSEGLLAHQDLLTRVAARLSNTPSATDHLMLTRWRVLSMCQYLLGGLSQELEQACSVALDIFAAHGVGAECDSALASAGAVIRRIEGAAHTVLPSISNEKRNAVSAQLDALAAEGATTIVRALRVLSAVRDRMNATVHIASLPGIRHRLELVAGILVDSGRSETERARAAAAILYVDEVRDVIPDTLGVIGMVDDDYALRVVLEDVAGDHKGAFLHWSERISSLWDELPFLQGVKLQRGDKPVPITWLDRVNSYVSYGHVIGAEESTLVLLQPSISCSPLHAIVSLIGLLALDAVTSFQSNSHALRAGQTYELDNFVVRFEGFAGAPTPGWLRLQLSDGVVYQVPSVADRMVPIAPRRLSRARDFSSRPKTQIADPVQRFFDWDATISPTLISNRLVLVASRQRALDLLDGVQSNGVHLLDHGLVRFMEAAPDGLPETHGTLVLVVPSLSTVRLLLDRGVGVQAVLVDGYERLNRGRHEVPFLLNRSNAPPIISWSPTGYYPPVTPAWLPSHKRLEVSPDDLVGILDLDDQRQELEHASLWEAATGLSVRSRATPLSPAEVGVVDAIDTYLRVVAASQTLPEYWQYHLTRLARTLRLLVTSTPAQWSEIRRYAATWSLSVDEKWSSLRSTAITAVKPVRDAEKCVIKLLHEIPHAFNSRATGLAAFLTDPIEATSQRSVVCDHAEQARVAASAITALGLTAVEAVVLRELPVCKACVVAGWVNTSFARRLWAHTPQAIVALVNDDDRRRWERAAEAQRQPAGQSLLGAVRGPGSSLSAASLFPIPPHDESASEEVLAQWGTEEAAPCVFLWLTGESEAKVLAPDAFVVVVDGDVVHERVAARLRPDDRIILGLGGSRWSPAEDFTEAVIAAVESSRPELVKVAKEWRRALRQFFEAQRLTHSQLQARLAVVGVTREQQTIEGWLDLDRATPIAPRGFRNELTALWPLVEQYATYALEDVTAACAELRELRAASGRVLLQRWKGEKVELEINAAWLDRIVEHLRSAVQIYEVEAVTFGQVPEAMLGWWMTSTLTGRFESQPPSTLPDGKSEAVG